MYKSGRHILAFAIAIILVTVFSLNIREHRVNAEETLPSLNEKKLVLKPGKKTRLSVVSDVKDYRVRWSSADTSVATVSTMGKVTAAADGKTNVFAVVTYNEKTVKLKCRVIVESEKTVKLAAVGDALIHENILNSGKQ